MFGPVIGYSSEFMSFPAFVYFIIALTGYERLNLVMRKSLFALATLLIRIIIFREQLNFSLNLLLSCERELIKPEEIEYDGIKSVSENFFVSFVE